LSSILRFSEPGTGLDVIILALFSKLKKQKQYLSKLLEASARLLSLLETPRYEEDEEHIEIILGFLEERQKLIEQIEHLTKAEADLGRKIANLFGLEVFSYQILRENLSKDQGDQLGDYLQEVQKTVFAIKCQDELIQKLMKDKLQHMGLKLQEIRQKKITNQAYGGYESIPGGCYINYKK
jgi:hypothetical protein